MTVAITIVAATRPGAIRMKPTSPHFQGRTITLRSPRWTGRLTAHGRARHELGNPCRARLADRHELPFTIADVDASGLWPGKAVTTIEPEGPFWEAEPEHQDYLQRYPNGYTCHFLRAGWVLPKRDENAAS